MNLDIKYIVILIVLCCTTILLIYEWSTIVNIILEFHTFSDGVIQSQQEYKNILFAVNSIAIALSTYQVFKKKTFLKYFFVVLSIVWGVYFFMHIVAFGILS